MNILNQIQCTFLEEARLSPVLLGDLATMERYISESYSDRSLIELLQNADDAQATEFYIQKIDESTFIVANNGREFSEEDIVALCRSGASTKHRNSNTIGFRGIGFKSVVNFSKAVHVHSGKYQFSFSKELTSELVCSDSPVPLVRIPHNFIGQKYLHQIRALVQEGYTTIFVFEVNSSAFIAEIKAFDSSCLLFLNNITTAIFRYNDHSETFKSVSSILGTGKRVLLLNSVQGKRTYMVFTAGNKTAIAFEVNDSGEIISSIPNAVVHSFMPTQEKLSLPLKLNGDFSSDPSRTRIIYDGETKEALQQCVDLLTSIIHDTLKSNNDPLKIINAISAIKLDPIRNLRGKSIDDYFSEMLIDSLKNVLGEYANSLGYQRIVLQPKWLYDDDCKAMGTHLNTLIVGAVSSKLFDGLSELASQLGFSELSINDALIIMQTFTYSKYTRAALLGQISNDAQYGIASELVDKIQKANIISFNGGVRKISATTIESVVDEEFSGLLSECIADTTSLAMLAKKIGISNPISTLNQISPPKIEIITEQHFKKYVIKKWRTVEKNVMAVLSQLDNIISVEDVSDRNIGYDLEAIGRDGERYFYEVKSVDSLGDMIAITNNEYSTANGYGERYYLAIAQQSDNAISVCFVQNPISTLSLTKRITKWEWICSEYKGTVMNCNLEDNI